MNIKQKRLIKRFLKENKHLYPPFIKNDLKGIYKGYTTSNDIINQILIYLNIVDIKTTDYYIFYKYINDIFNLNNKKNILEVGSGLIPILASLIAININRNIEVIELLDIYNLLGVIKVGNEFNKETNIDKYDFIYGFRPCNATEDLLIKCLKEKKEFAIYLCNCKLYPQDKDYYINLKEWDSLKYYNYLKELINKYKDKKIKVDIVYIDGLLDKCPIIIGKYNVYK